MSSTSGVGSTGLRSYEDYVNEQRTPKNELGKTEFLELITAQLQYQDPLEPTKDSDFIAQLAQFSSLDQLDALNKTMSSMQYYNFVGKYAYAEVKLDDGTDAAISGIVDRVVSTSDGYKVQIGDYIIDASKITQVYDKELFTSNPLLSTSNLIGRNIKATVVEVVDEEEVQTEITGVVKRVAMENGRMMAYLQDETKVPVSSIHDISE